MNPTDVMVVFSTSNHLFSKVIRLLTRSKVSHCSVWFSLFGVPVVLQASVGGVKPAVLSEWLLHNQVVKKFKPKIDISSGLTEAVELLNTKYDYVGILGYLPVLIGRWLHKKIKNPIASPTKMVCSEFILHLDFNGKIPEWNDLDWGSTVPEILMENCKDSFEEIP